MRAATSSPFPAVSALAVVFALGLPAAAAVSHGGGRRFGRESWQYQVFREWIAAGSPWGKGSGEVKSVAVTPPEHAFARPGETGQLVVKATFADGSAEDVTPFCEFRTND